MREAIGGIGGGQALVGDADTVHRGGRARGPSLRPMVEGQCSGFDVQHPAEIGPEPVPGRIGLGDHADIAVLVAIGVADEAVLVDGGPHGVGDARLFEDPHDMPPAGQRPGRREAHDPAADDRYLHGGIFIAVSGSWQAEPLGLPVRPRPDLRSRFRPT